MTDSLLAYEQDKIFEHCTVISFINNKFINNFPSKEHCSEETSNCYYKTWYIFNLVIIEKHPTMISFINSVLNSFFPILKILFKLCDYKEFGIIKMLHIESQLFFYNRSLLPFSAL